MTRETFAFLAGAAACLAAAGTAVRAQAPSSAGITATRSPSDDDRKTGRDQAGRLARAGSQSGREALLRRLSQRQGQGRRIVTRRVRRLAGGAEPRDRGEGHPETAGRLHAAAAGAASRRRDVRDADLDARVGGRRGGCRETQSRRPHLPASEPSRILARRARSARARRGRRQLAAARHQERQLRQHRRRAGAVADPARGVFERSERDQPDGDRRSQRADGGLYLQQPRICVAASVGSRRGRAVRHARRLGRPARLPGRRGICVRSGSRLRIERALRGHRHLDRR